MGYLEYVRFSAKEYLLTRRGSKEKYAKIIENIIGVMSIMNLFVWHCKKASVFFFILEIVVYMKSCVISSVVLAS